MKQLLTVFFLFFTQVSNGQNLEIYQFDGVIGGPGTLVYDGSILTSTPELLLNRVNLVLLADGYSGTEDSSDYARFSAQKNAFISQLFGIDDEATPFSSPFFEYADYFNIFWVWVESNGSGVGCIQEGTSNCTHSPNCYYDGCFQNIDNHFGTTHDNAGLHRFILPNNPEAIVNEVQTLFTNDEAQLNIIILANTINNIPYGVGYPLDYRRYGGGAIPDVVNNIGISATTRGTAGNNYVINPSDPKSIALNQSGATAVHELGHSFAGLLDEYWYDMADLINPCDAGVCNEGINKTANSNTTDSNHPWAEWMDLGSPTIGVSQHQDNGPCGNLASTLEPWYRPTSNLCKMAVNTMPFCAVCRQAIIERIHEQVNPIDGFSPLNSGALPASSTLVFDVDLIEPNPSWMQVKWYVNDVLVETIAANGAAAGATDFSWQFDCSNTELQDGENIIKAVVFDHTGNPDPQNDTRMVRKASHAAHVHEVEWTVNWDAASVATNLYIKDVPQDTGEDPGYAFGWFFDESPDIKVQNAPMTGVYAWSDIIHENPNVALSPAYVYVRISNRGCQASTGGTLGVYNTTVSSATSWEDGNWTGNGLGYQIDSDVAIPVIAGNAEAILELEWVITDITPGGYINWNTCILARLEDVPNDPIVPPTPLNITEWVSQLGNIAMHNVSVIDLDEPGIISVGGKGYAGGHVYVGTTSHTIETLDIHFDVDDDKVSKTLNEEAEIVVGFVERGWDVSGAIVDSMLHGLTRLDSTLFLVTNEHAWISNLQIPSDSLVPAFVGFGFLTAEVSDTMNYAYHLSQYRSSAKDTVLAAQHFHIKRVSRNLFSANAGADVELLAGDSITLSATSIGESADYNWYNAAGTLLATTQTMKVSPSSTSAYTLEVIADVDAYKDYDEVAVAVTNGQITSVVPNPTSTTTVVAYAVVNVTTAAIRVVQVNTSTEMNNYTVAVGSGTQTINATGYAPGAYLIQLKGDGNVLDTSTLIVQ